MREIRMRVATDFTIIRLCLAFVNNSENAQCSNLLYKISHGLWKFYTDFISNEPSATIIVLVGWYRITILLNAHISELKTTG
jgi:hypothetical protein